MQLLSLLFELFNKKDKKEQEHGLLVQALLKSDEKPSLIDDECEESNVYKVQHHGAWYALKTYKPGVDQDHMKREVKALQQLAKSKRPELFVRLLDFGTSADGKHHVALEYLDGYNEIKDSKDVPSAAQENILQGVRILRENNMCPRDIFRNILYWDDGRIKFIDFGRAVFADADPYFVAIDWSYVCALARMFHWSEGFKALKDAVSNKALVLRVVDLFGQKDATGAQMVQDPTEHGIYARWHRPATDTQLLLLQQGLACVTRLKAWNQVSDSKYQVLVEELPKSEWIPLEKFNFSEDDKNTAVLIQKWTESLDQLHSQNFFVAFLSYSFPGIAVHKTTFDVKWFALTDINRVILSSEKAKAANTSYGILDEWLRQDATYRPAPGEETKKQLAILKSRLVNISK